MELQLGSWESGTSKSREGPHLNLYFVEGGFNGAVCLAAEMRERVWGGLPSELLERVLAMLPTTTLLRFRAVCKSWRTLLKSSKFKELVAASGGRHPPVPGPVCSFQMVPAVRPWHMPQPPHPLAGGVGRFICDVGRVDLSFLPNTVLAWGLDSTLAQDGLLCIFDSRFSNQLTDVCVVNPMTRSWKVIPMGAMRTFRMVEWRVKVVVQEKEGPDSGFRLIVVWDGETGPGCGVFSSLSNSWEVSHWQRQRLPPLRRTDEFGFQLFGSVFHLDVLTSRAIYSYSTSGFPPDGDYVPGTTVSTMGVCQLEGVNPGGGPGVLTGPDICFHTRDLVLVEHEDVVFFVVGYRQGSGRQAAVEIGELDEGDMVWKRVSVLPIADLTSKWLPSAKRSLEGGEDFMGLGGAVVLGDCIWLSVGVSGDWHVLKFDLRAREWQSVMHGRLLDSECKQWCMGNKLFQPRVDFKF